MADKVAAADVKDTLLAEGKVSAASQATKKDRSRKQPSQKKAPTATTKDLSCDDDKLVHTEASQVDGPAEVAAESFASNKASRLAGKVVKVAAADTNRLVAAEIPASPAQKTKGKQKKHQTHAGSAQKTEWHLLRYVRNIGRGTALASLAVPISIVAFMMKKSLWDLRIDPGTTHTWASALPEMAARNTRAVREVLQASDIEVARGEALVQQLRPTSQGPADWPLCAAEGTCLFTTRDLRQFTGSPNNPPLLTSIVSYVFNVSMFPQVYGRGSRRSAWVGKDISRSVALDTMNENDLLSQSLADLTEKQWEKLFKRIEGFQSRYADHLVGRVVDWNPGVSMEYINAKGGFSLSPSTSSSASHLTAGL